MNKEFSVISSDLLPKLSFGIAEVDLHLISGELNEAATILERRIESKTGDVEKERLFWVIVQLDRKVLPISALVSPWREVELESSANEELKNLKVGVGLKLAENLFKKDRERLALSIIEELKPMVEKLREPSRTKVLNHFNGEKEVQGLNLTFSESERPLEQLQTKNGNKSLIFLFVFLLATVILGIAAYQNYSSRETDSEKYNEKLTQNQIAFFNLKDLPPPALPEFSSKSPDVIGQRLSALNANLSAVSERVKNLKTTPTEAPTVEKEKLVAIDMGNGKLDPKRAPINVGPPVPETTQKELQPDKLDQYDVHELDPDPTGITPKIGGTTRQDNRNQDSMVYPPSQRDRGDRGREQRAPQEERRNLDGAPLQNYEVSQFEPPLAYRTIVKTRVLSAPSILSAVNEELPSNSKIQVVSRMGQWLELRSQSGRRGYIYSQDASEE